MHCGEVRLPRGVGVGEDGSDVLFVCCCNVFLGVSVSCVREGSEDVQSCSSFSVYVVCVCLERHSSIISHSKDGGVV